MSARRQGRWISGFWKTCLATTVYAAAHTLFASQGAKRWAGLMIGQRNRNAFYRSFYLVQSAAGMAALIVFIRRQPTRVLYDHRGYLGRTFHAVQLSGLLWALWSAWLVRLPEITGLRPALQGVLADDFAICPEPEAQGPALESGQLRVAGPFRWSRHPLNFAPLPILWFHPRMGSNLLAFTLVSTLYFPLGSKHEERRLLARYGEPYRQYLTSGIPFYLPGKPKKSD